MTPFYFIDGPLKGTSQDSDFRPTLVNTGEIYYKYTFAKRTDIGILFTDIASVNPQLRELQIHEKIPFYIKQEQDMVINAVLPGGEIV